MVYVTVGAPAEASEHAPRQGPQLVAVSLPPPPDETATRGPTYGAPGRSRTCDQRLRKPLLYPLSYWSLAFARELHRVGEILGHVPGGHERRDATRNGEPLHEHLALGA